MLAIAGDPDGRIQGIVRKSLEDLSLSFQQRSAMMVKGNWKVQPITVNPQFKSVQWTADISLYDEIGAAVATFAKQQRENAITETQATTIAYREAEKAIARDFVASIRAYLTRIVTGS
jgi:hypothetical protein